MRLIGTLSASQSPETKSTVYTADFATVTFKMPYLDAIMMEVNRLHPTIHATLRVINREVALTSGKTSVMLKPGMLVYLSYLHLYTSPKYWGTNAREFVPERWLDGRNKDGRS